MSLQHLIPSGYDWIASLQKKKFETKNGSISYEEFRDRIFIALTDMQVGDVYDICRRVRNENLDAFVKVAFEFADMNYPRYMFIDNFTKIKRYE